MMDEVKHTPGPWAIVNGGHPGDEFFTVGQPGGREVADSPEYVYRSSGETIANARLIAAAPDLLAACMVIDDIEDVDDVNRARHVARAAILKATKE